MLRRISRPISAVVVVALGLATGLITDARPAAALGSCSDNPPSEPSPNFSPEGTGQVGQYLVSIESLSCQPPLCLFGRPEQASDSLEGEAETSGPWKVTIWPDASMFMCFDNSVSKGDTVSCLGLKVVFGTDNQDDLVLTSGYDYLVFGFDESDVISIMDGDHNHEIYGGEGDDSIGTTESTRGSGGGTQRIYGEGDDDEIDGANGDDFIVGGSGEDWILGHQGDDHLWGGGDKDDLRGGDGENTAGSGEDTLVDGAGTHEWIVGEDGVDHLWATGAASWAWGGDNDDTVIVRDAPTGQALGEGGTDRVCIQTDAADSNASAVGGDDPDFVHGDGDVHISGGEGNDELFAESADSMWVEGGSGEDILDLCNGVEDHAYGDDERVGPFSVDTFMFDNALDELRDRDAGGEIDILVQCQ